MCGGSMSVTDHKRIEYTGAVKKTAPVIVVSVSMIICTQDRVRYPHFKNK